MNYDDSFLSQRQELISMKAQYPEAEILNEYIIPKRPVTFREPDNITLEIYEAAAGDVPLITIGNAFDFEDFIVNLIHKVSRHDNISQMGVMHQKAAEFISMSDLRAKPEISQLRASRI